MIESLDMSVLLEDYGRKKPEKPKLKTNTNSSFTQYEKPQAQETAPEEGIISNNKRSNYDDEFIKSFWQEFNKDETADIPFWQYEKETEKEPVKNEKYDNYITQKQAGGKIVSPNKSYGSRGERYANQDEEFMSRYNYADDYLMSEGENAFESTVKGMTNRARSAVGTGAEDFAYFLYDNIPEYKPAKTVLNNKTASIISEKADSQFADAKANTGAIGDKIIDIADESAEMLGYSMFGPKALYVFATAEGFGEYRSLREQGYSEIDSFVGALGKAGYTVAAEKVEDIAFSKLLNGAMSSNNAVANANLVSDYISNNKNSYLNKSSEMFDDLEYLNYNGENVYTSPYLHEQLEININGETKFIPNGAEFSTVKTIAGNGTEIPIRDVQRLIYTYGGNISDWKKQVGKIESEKYYFDIHWYELDGKQYEPKIKNWGNK